MTSLQIAKPCPNLDILLGLQRPKFLLPFREATNIVHHRYMRPLSGVAGLECVQPRETQPLTVGGEVWRGSHTSQLDFGLESDTRFNV